MSRSILTMGHGGRTLPDLLAALGAHGIERVVDVRMVPRSRRSPDFNRSVIGPALAGAGIGYEYDPVLAGAVPERASGPSPNGFWAPESFRSLADHALSSAFQAALDRLVALSRRERVALLGTAAAWWRCPRRIIADHLIVRGVAVGHIGEAGTVEPASLTATARRRADGLLVYPAPADPQPAAGD